MNFKNIIFDLDGVLVDSEPFHALAKRETAKRFGITLDDPTLLRFTGRTDNAFFEYLRKAHDLEASVTELMHMKSEVYLQQVARIQPIAGVSDFVGRAHEAGKQMALVTSSPRQYVQAVFEALPFNKLFKFVVCAEDVTQHKPHPEPYLTAVQLLASPLESSVVIEDSENGVRSAKTAGLFTAAILTTCEGARLSAAGADLVSPTYAELKRELLE